MNPPLNGSTPRRRWAVVSRTRAVGEGRLIKPMTRLRKKLRARVTRYERRYELPTAVMAGRIKEGAVTETAEISKWLQAANVLQWLDREREESTA